MQEENVLLIESWNFVDNPITVIDESNQSLTEAVIKKDGNLYIQGIFMQADVVNGNRRLYPKRVLEKAVDLYIKEQVNTKQALGELNHPARPHVDPLQACILIEKLWWEGNNVMGKARVLTGDNGVGDKVAALIRAGWVPGVSSRGLGRIIQKNGYNEVQEGFRLTVGVDVVWGPSAPQAFVKPVYESKDPDNKQPYKQIQDNSVDPKNQVEALTEALKRFNQKNKDGKTFTSLTEKLQNFKLNNK